MQNHRPKPRLTTKAACRVVGIDRDRFNEHVARGDFGCAPDTIPGRARLFDADALLTLRIFSDLLEDGFPAKLAGRIACSVGQAAKDFPNEDEIIYYDLMIGSSMSGPGSKNFSITDSLSGSTIKKRIGFNVRHLRYLVDCGIAEEQSIIGEDD